MLLAASCLIALGLFSAVAVLALTDGPAGTSPYAGHASGRFAGVSKRMVAVPVALLIAGCALLATL